MNVRRTGYADAYRNQGHFFISFQYYILRLGVLGASKNP